MSKLLLEGNLTTLTELKFGRFLAIYFASLERE